MTERIGSKVYSRFRGCSNGTLINYDVGYDVCQVVLTNSKHTKQFIGSEEFKKQYSFSRPRSKK